MGAGLIETKLSGNTLAGGLLLESTWRARAALLAEEELDTEIWADLHDAVDLAAEGDLDSAVEWLDETESHFLSVWSNYQGATPVYEDEITSETVVGHLFLKEGLGHWLDALAMLREGASGEAVLARAENGQRLLVFVQILEEENAAARQRFFANWN